MSHYLRTKIAAALLDSISNCSKVTCEDPSGKLARLLSVLDSTKKFDDQSPQLAIRQHLLIRELNLDPKVIDHLKNYFSGLRVEDRNLTVKISSSSYVSSIIDDVISDGEKYGHGFHVHRYIRTKNETLFRSKQETVVVEFGSPNVAKPLHAGHLRSSIIGQFIATLNETLGNNVVRMSFLGDWGTQFGLLAVGFKMFGDVDQLEQRGIQHLLEVYVKVNKQVEDEGLTSETYCQALDFMRKLESGDQEALTLWHRFRDLSLDTSVDVFQRLGVKFDVVEHESDYVQACVDLWRTLEERQLLSYDRENVGVVPGEKAKIVLRKSDGTSLYLTRDVAAILNRAKLYNFDRIHYVVDAGQGSHFQKLRKTLELMGECKLSSQSNLHVPFGRVIGMSTRKGTSVQLMDILDEAKQRMLEIASSKSSTRSGDLDLTAEHLARSAVFIQDLREKRQRDYAFDWDRMLSNKGATGVFLQYGHARLCSMEAHYPEYLTTNTDLSCLRENEAVRLAQHLSRFDEVLNACYDNLEPHHIVHYLLDLVNLTNVALSVLSVKNSADDVAKARMRLFHASRLILTNGIRILGLTPLREI